MSSTSAKFTVFAFTNEAYDAARPNLADLPTDQLLAGLANDHVASRLYLAAIKPDSPATMAVISGRTVSMSKTASGDLVTSGVPVAERRLVDGGVIYIITKLLDPNDHP